MRSVPFFLILGALLLAGRDLPAQQYFNIHNPITLPDKSQEALVRQRIGYTDLTLHYHSPGARGRQVWGGLVPFGEVWRAGANENTVFTVTHAVEVEGQALPAGSYGLHLLVEEDQWTFVFSQNHTSWGSYFYSEAEDALRVTVPTEAAPEYREWMSFDFRRRDRGAASIVLTWGDRRAVVDLTLDIDQIALDHIRQQLRSDAYWEWFSWCQAAAYCAEYGINTEEALVWIDRSIGLQENFANWDVKADLLRQLGQEEDAEEAIVRAMELGTAAELERYGRRFLNQQDYRTAASIFDQALAKDGQYWRAHFHKGKALEGLGTEAAALEAYRQALEYAPESNRDMVRAMVAKLEK